MALTLTYPRRFDTSDFTVLTAAVKVLEGACTCSITASGLATGGAFSNATHRFCGFALDTAQAGQRLRLKNKGRTLLNVTGASAAKANAVVYASDDNTFTVTPAGGEVAIGRIAWVEEGEKAVVDFDASIEAGQVGTQINTGGSVSLEGPDGTKYAALPVDANGNIIANVNHRTGAIADLLTLSGGDGEIGVATDVAALVRFNGVAGQAVAFYAAQRRESATFLAGTGVVNTGASWIPYKGLETTTFTPSWFDDANQWFVVPSWAKIFEFDYTITWAVDASGSQRKMRIEYSMNSGATWFGALFAIAIALNYNSAMAPSRAGKLLVDLEAQSIPAGALLRLTLNHDSANSVNAFSGGAIQQASFRSN